jgi:peptide/nickel transport system substrate-binding protein
MIVKIKRIKWIAIVLVFALLAAACSTKQAANEGQPLQSNSTTESAQGNEKEPVSGGTLTFALATSPDTLDPGASGFAVAHRVIRNIFDSLVYLDTDGTIKPWLAVSWTKSDDGKTYTFKLRDDVKFHDGTPFNAQAVKANFDRVVANGRGQSVSLLGPYESSTVIDEYTIEIKLSRPFEPFLSGLSSAFLGISSPTAIEKYGDQYSKNPVGSGPFKFVKWSENDRVELERNPDYNWGPPSAANKGPAHIDKLVFFIIPEEATRIGGVQSGQVLAAETVPPQLIESLKNSSKIRIEQAITNGTAFSLYFNVQNEPWNDVKVRQAVQQAVDVDAIVQTLYLGTYKRAWSSLTAGILGYDASLENELQYSADKANQLLDELGWKVGADGIREKDGKKLTLRYLEPSPNREKRNDIAVMVQQQLKKIGVQVELNITKDYHTFITSGEYDLFGNSQVKADPDVIYNIFHSKRVYTNGGTNWSRLNDPEIDKLLEQGSSESDPEKRKEIYKQVQQYVVKNAVIIPVYEFPYTVAAVSSVEGLKFDLLGYPLFYDVYLRK